MSIQIHDDIHWINVEHETKGGKHLHNAVYLVQENDNNILIDTGSSYHEDSVKREIEALTEGSGLDAIILSKVHLPHAGSAREFLSVYDDPEIVITGGQRQLYGLPEATQGVIGETVGVCGRDVTLVNPPLVDVQHTTWILDENTGTLFAAEALCHYHHPGECDLVSSQLAGGIEPENIRHFHQEMLVYLQYVDPETIHDAIEELFNNNDISMIAPIHGNPVVEEDIGDYLGILNETVTDMSESYEYPA